MGSSYIPLCIGVAKKFPTWDKAFSWENAPLLESFQWGRSEVVAISPDIDIYIYIHMYIYIYIDIDIDIDMDMDMDMDMDIDIDIDIGIDIDIDIYPQAAWSV